MTILETLNTATKYLESRGIESSRLNAEHILAHVLQKRKRIDLYLEFDHRMSEGDCASLHEIVHQRGDGYPLQHLLGSVEFMGRTFACDSRALIPRPETEQLVEIALGLVAADDARILDVGTGSGVISLTLALTYPHAMIAACDISKDALALAQENAQRHHLQNRVNFFQSDLLTNIDGRFDLIIANLPYVASADLSALSQEVRHDPISALDGGDDGLRIIERLIVAARDFLAPNAHLVLEIGHGQAPRCKEILIANNYRDITTHRDYQEFERFIIASYG